MRVMTEEEALKLVASALPILPEVVGFIREALAAGHGDPVTRRKVADVLPVESESRQAERVLDAALVTADAPTTLVEVPELAGAAVIAPAIDVPHDAEPPPGGAAE